MKSEKGFFWASDYWSQNVYQQAKNSLDEKYAYGEEGDDNWQIIALSEGWANYRQWQLSIDKLNWRDAMNRSTDAAGRERYFTERQFPRTFGAMFDSLRIEGCSYTNIEKSLCTYSVAGFKDNLTSKYPNNSTRITEIIEQYE